MEKNDAYCVNPRNVSPRACNGDCLVRPFPPNPARVSFRRFSLPRFGDFVDYDGTFLGCRDSLSARETHQRSTRRGLLSHGRCTFLASSYCSWTFRGKELSAGRLVEGAETNKPMWRMRRSPKSPCLQPTTAPRSKPQEH
ncbi:hypothetical protein FA13DRAFT_1740063 [Coprinellus micaceus]|uniref:Uncharacterized protein n=1 Tax=Coprinellus micaceus TaxID=71717 RepID=A0A4Y7SNM2_COPMI|nr:hypothetical protein FA13DRAFT_1740063 [Coprinellus micaceus]